MIDAKKFWQVLGQRAIGVSIVTAGGAGSPAGFLALSVAHVTADPPSMLVSIDDRTSALSSVLENKHFAVNYLPADAANLADIFGGKTELKGADRFKADEWDTLTSGAPTLKNAIGVIDCVLANTFRYESTTIVVGRIVDLRHTDSPTLVVRRGQYSTL